MRYKLGSLVKGRRGRALLPVIRESRALELSYMGAMNEMLLGLRRVLTSTIIAEGRRELRLSDADESVFERARQLARQLAQIASGTVNRILNLEAKRHTTQFMAVAHRALGVDLSAVVKASDLESLVQLAALRNAALITQVSEDLVSRVAQTVTSHVISGGSVKDLTKLLVSDFGFAKKRAQLIARDQTAKFNADLNEFRHVQAGCFKYNWRTSEDERVRPLHHKIKGREYEYGKPTDAEQGLPPGKPVRCRCYAQAIVEFD